jgi:hypothetical protein
VLADPIDPNVRRSERVEVEIDGSQLAIAIPCPANSTVVAEPAGTGPGHWAGAPSVVLAADGTFYLAYRMRRPAASGRGYANVIARSQDGVHFETVLILPKDDFDADSLERPALVELPGGGWRVYVSCATVGSKHWRVEALDAPSPERFGDAKPRTVLAGDARVGLKDPYVIVDGDRFHFWVCAHPLEIAGAEDRMTTVYGSSADGIAIDLETAVLAPRANSWDARGTRVASVIQRGNRVIAYYDGRATADENAEECTGIATGQLGAPLVPIAGPFSAAAGASLRYLDYVEDGSGLRLFYETTRRDGAHDLRTEYVPRPLGASQS